MLKGCCYWTDDIPSEDAPHYIIISSDTLSDGLVLVVVISSIKYNERGEKKFYDSACVLSVDDIKTESGEQVLTKSSFIRYQYAIELHEKDIIERTLSGRYQFKCRISDELLSRIQVGAIKSRELSPRYKKKYFGF